MTQEERNEKISEQLAVDKSKSGLVEKLVFTLLPVCVSAIGWLLTEVSSLNNQITILNDKIAIVVDAENKAIPPQGTTIEMQAIKFSAAKVGAEMKLDMIEKITEVHIAGMQERADIKARLSVLESKIKR